MNDGSTDHCEEIINEYCKNHKNIVYLYQENSGVSCARNLALEHITGDYVTFVDSDDYVDSLYCISMLNGIIENTADICTCRAIDHHIEKKGDDRCFPESNNVKILSSDEYSFFDDSLQKAVCCVLFRRSIVEGIRFRTDIYVSEDSVFLAECIHKAQKIAVLYKNLYHYIIFPSSTSHGIYDEKKKTELIAWNLISKINNDKKFVYETCRARYADRCLKVIRKYHFNMGVEKNYYKYACKEFRKNTKYIFSVNRKKPFHTRIVENVAYFLFSIFPWSYPLYYYARYKEKS